MRGSARSSCARRPPHARTHTRTLAPHTRHTRTRAFGLAPLRTGVPTPATPCQVLKSHQLIRALVEQCLLERRSKEALAVQMADYEAAAAAQHSEYAADVAHLRAQLAKARAQSIN